MRGNKKMSKKTSIKKLFYRKDCWGWAWECAGKRHKYCWQNDNDLGLLGYIDDACDLPETIVRKIKVMSKPNRYIYILRNNYAVNEEHCGPAITEPQLIAAIKYCHSVDLTWHELMLARRVYW